MENNIDYCTDNNLSDNLGNDTVVQPLLQEPAKNDFYQNERARAIISQMVIPKGNIRRRFQRS